ncbi:hypothetical protein KIPB_010572, partial [Kipferlia bialata]
VECALSAPLRDILLGVCRVCHSVRHTEALAGIGEGTEVAVAIFVQTMLSVQRGRERLPTVDGEQEADTVRESVYDEVDGVGSASDVYRSLLGMDSPPLTPEERERQRDEEREARLYRPASITPAPTPSGALLLQHLFDRAQERERLHEWGVLLCECILKSDHTNGDIYRMPPFEMVMMALPDCLSFLRLTDSALSLPSPPTLDTASVRYLVGGVGSMYHVPLEDMQFDIDRPLPPCDYQPPLAPFLDSSVPTPEAVVMKARECLPPEGEDPVFMEDRDIGTAQGMRHVLEGIARGGAGQVQVAEGVYEQGLAGLSVLASSLTAARSMERKRAAEMGLVPLCIALLARCTHRHSKRVERERERAEQRKAGGEGEDPSVSRKRALQWHGETGMDIDSKDPRVGRGFRQTVLRTLAVCVDTNPWGQDLARHLGVLELSLVHMVSDDMNPQAREWSAMLLRGMTFTNTASQRHLASLDIQSVSEVTRQANAQAEAQ